MYVFSFCLFLLITVEKLHKVTGGGRSIAFQNHFGPIGILADVFTLCLAIYLVVLMRKVTNKIERLGMLLLEAICALWFLNLLHNLGIGWASIPYGSHLVASIYGLLTLLAGIRTAQVAWIRVHAITQIQGNKRPK